MKELKIGNLYKIKGKIYKLCCSSFKNCVNGSKVERFYFKKPAYEDGEAFRLSKFIENNTQSTGGTDF